MDDSSILPAPNDNGGVDEAAIARYRSLAGHWRRLAAATTTARTRTLLIDRARACEALANGTGLVARPVGDAPRKSSAP